MLSFALFTLPFNQMNIGKSGEKSPLSASVDPYASNVGKSKMIFYFFIFTCKVPSSKEFVFSPTSHFIFTIKILALKEGICVAWNIIKSSSWLN